MGRAIWMNMPGALKRYQQKAHGKVVPRGSAARGKRKTVRRVSKALAKAKRAYNARARVWLVGKISPVSGKPATQVHHKFGRRGRLLMWEPGWIPVTAEDHAWIDANRDEARAKGWLCPKGIYDDYKRAVEFVTVEITPLNCLKTAANMLEEMKR